MRMKKSIDNQNRMNNSNIMIQKNNLRNNTEGQMKTQEDDKSQSNFHGLLRNLMDVAKMNKGKYYESQLFFVNNIKLQQKPDL